MDKNVIDALAPLRARPGKRRTNGLDDATLLRLVRDHADLAAAIEAAAAEFARIESSAADLLDLDEDAQIQAVQADFVNFYPQDAVNPYVALAARGPWIVTLKGAVLHDSGGSGMLGFVHVQQFGELGAHALVLGGGGGDGLAQVGVAGGELRDGGVVQAGGAALAAVGAQGREGVGHGHGDLLDIAG